ncbi:MAG: fatty acyl-AMP ligase [Myxococcales bacterium]|nr:fatty acyl-AMP ligase [Myxococcales bacterium]
MVVDPSPAPAPAPAPASATTLVEVLEYHARAQPERVHVLLREEDGAEDPVRYGELHHEALSVAAGLRARGLSPGDRVAIMLPTGRGYFAAFLGALVAGGVPVPLYPPFRLDRIAEYVARAARILDDAQARYLVTFERVARVADITRDRAPSVEEVISIARLVAHPSAPATVRVAAGDTALIQYTSGSTGDPKGVELTHANVLSNIRAAASGVALAAGDVVVSWLPLYHDMGLIGGWLMNLYFGTPVVLMSPLTFLTRPERWLQVLDEYRATRSVAPNFAFDLCVKRIPPEVIAGLELRQVKSLLNGSEPILPETLDRFVEHCAPAGLRREALFCAYGLAENMVAVTFPPVLRAPRVDAIVRSVFEETGRAEPAGDDVPEGEALRFVGVGSPVAEHEVRIVDDADAPVPERQQGRLHFRGPSTFKGYFRNPAATAAVKRDGGWVDSGDLAYMADGEVFITGRVKDVIIKGGRNYYPHELEAAAAAVPGIRQGCVAAFAERASGAATESIVVVAETRERDAARREALERRVIEAITDAVGVPPDRVVLAEPGAVPKTSSGKIRRAEARARWRSGALDEGHGSFARQAAGLYLGSAPRRLRSLV